MDGFDTTVEFAPDCSPTTEDIYPPAPPPPPCFLLPPVPPPATNTNSTSASVPAVVTAKVPLDVNV
jgi:hypothetical protein